MGNTEDSRESVHSDRDARQLRPSSKGSGCPEITVTEAVLPVKRWNRFEKPDAPEPLSRETLVALTMAGRSPIVRRR